MSHLQGRLDRLERRVSAQAGPQRPADHSALTDYFNSLTTVQAREEFIALVTDVEAIEGREHKAREAGGAIPPRSADERARLDELDRYLATTSSKHDIGE